MVEKELTVPLLDLKAQYAAIREEVLEAVNRVLESQQFILGPEVEALEIEIAEYSGCHYGVGISSGTDALLIALMVINIQPGDEIILPSYSFFATAGAVVRLGARPVFVDIDPDTFNLDFRQIEQAITARTRAIIPVHLFGQMVEMAPVIAIAHGHKLVVIEDAAQAIGAEYEGKRAGSFGHMGCFSFFPSKNLGGIGDGGMVVTNDRELSERLKLYRNHGFRPKYYSKVVGGNFRLDAIQAAVLRVKLRHLEDWIRARQRNAHRYRELFSNRELTTMQPRPVNLPVEKPGYRHIYNQYVIRCEQRNSLLNYLSQHHIGAEVYYPQPLHLQECFSELGYHLNDFPKSEKASQETLALPIYPELSETMLRRVAETVTQFYAF